VKVRLLFLIIIIFFSIPADAFQGPFKVRNLYPIFLHADQPLLESAEMKNSLSLSLSHSSTYTVQDSAHWKIYLDMEITEFTLRFNRVIDELFELGIDVPIYIIGGGFLDGFLEDFHSSIGAGNYGREERPKNELLYEVWRDNKLIVKGSSTTSIGDIRLSIKRHILRSDSWLLGVMGNVEIPLDNGRDGLSNGSLDAGISLLFDARLSETLMVYSNLGAVFPGDVRGYERLDLKNFIYGGVSIESMPWKTISLLVQVLAQGPVYPETDLGAVDRGAITFAFGGRYHTGRHSIDLSLTEDLSTSGAPDFIFNISYRMEI